MAPIAGTGAIFTPAPRKGRPSSGELLCPTQQTQERVNSQVSEPGLVDGLVPLLGHPNGDLVRFGADYNLNTHPHGLASVLIARHHDAPQPAMLHGKVPDADFRQSAVIDRPIHDRFRRNPLACRDPFVTFSILSCAGHPARLTSRSIAFIRYQNRSADRVDCSASRWTLSVSTPNSLPVSSAKGPSPPCTASAA